MEVDSSDVNSESSRVLDDSEEPTTPDDKNFQGYHFTDQEKDEEATKTPQIRYLHTVLPDVKVYKNTCHRLENVHIQTLYSYVLLVLFLNHSV